MFFHVRKERKVDLGLWGQQGGLGCNSTGLFGHWLRRAEKSGTEARHCCLSVGPPEDTSPLRDRLVLVDLDLLLDLSFGSYSLNWHHGQVRAGHRRSALRPGQGRHLELDGRNPPLAGLPRHRHQDRSLPQHRRRHHVPL